MPHSSLLPFPHRQEQEIGSEIWFPRDNRSSQLIFGGKAFAPAGVTRKGYANMYASLLSCYCHPSNLFQVLFYYISALRIFFLGTLEHFSLYLSILHFESWRRQGTQADGKLLKALANMCSLIDCLIKLALCKHIKKFLPHFSVLFMAGKLEKKWESRVLPLRGNNNLNTPEMDLRLHSTTNVCDSIRFLASIHVWFTWLGRGALWGA